MTSDGPAQRRLLSIFRTELPEQLDTISEGLLRLEKQSCVQPGEVNACMRAAHNIKGAAHSVGITPIGDIAHRLESIFDGLRTGDLQPSAELVNLCLQALGQASAILDAFEKGQPPGFDIDSVLLRLDHAQVPGDFKPWSAVPEPQPTEPTRAEPPLPQPPGPASGDPPPAGAGAGDTPPPCLKQGAEDSVRVSVTKLESLMAIAEELQVARIRLEDRAETFKELRRRIASAAGLLDKAWRSDGGDHRDEGRSLCQEAMKEVDKHVWRLGRDLRSQAGDMGDVIASLLDDLRKVRMVAVSTLVPELSRTARTLSHELGKRVTLEVTGGDTEADRAVLDLLRTPLMHLLRNAIDHGIERPEDRLAAGKAEIGRLALTIGLDGNQIAVVLEDDGRGIDLESLIRSAIAKSLVSEDEAARFDRQQALDLVFLPGFSTKQMISDISGRGFGLDIVRSAILRMNGTIDVATVSGQGCRFTFRVPLTLSAEHALVVRAAGQSFALPIYAVDRVVLLGRDAVRDVEAGQVVLVEDQPIPLRSLADALQLPQPARQETAGLPAVIMAADRHIVAMWVDEIVGTQEIVIKRLAPPLDGLPAISGGTLTGRGTIVLVLNPHDLVASAIGSRGRQVADEAVRDAVAVRHVLVVDDSLTSRALQKNILECAGYPVETAANGVDAWEALQRGAFDMVITDVDMPLMDGFELTEKIKGSQRFRNIPVIIVTSMAKDADRRRGIAVGADGYVVKGKFETKLLLDLVRQLMAG